MQTHLGLDTENLSNSIRPQDDLFRHVNSVWLKRTAIPEDKAVYGSFHILADEAELAVRGIIEDASKNPTPGVSQQIGDLYASFMQEDLIEKLGWQPISHEIEQARNLESLRELTKLLGQLQRHGVSGLWGSYVDNDPGDPSRYLVHLYQSGLGLPDEAYYREDKYAEIREEYLQHVQRMFALVGWSLADARDASLALMDFETALAAKHWSVVETRDAEKTYNLRQLVDLQESTPTWSWISWLEGAKVPATTLEEVVVMMPSYFEQLAELYDNKNLPTLRIWLEWQILRSRAPYLNRIFVEERFSFYGTKLTGQPQNRPRWKRAVGIVEGGLGEAVGQIYVERHFKPAAKQRMDELVVHLIKAYEKSIKQLDWMTAKTKKRALEKLKKFTPKIGYPTKWKDYSNILIDRADLLGNVRRISAWEMDREAAKIGRPLDREEWFMTPQTVNAYYNPGFNEIVFPAAILQPPFFSEDADDAVNFGAIGAVIGHEIGHGFDDQGSKYDGDGKLASWWTDTDRAAFEQRTKNLIDQYGALSPVQLDDEHKVNGELTIGENIGDLGGLGIAWKAYLQSLGKEQPPVIDGLTAEQRFLLSWAQAWRTVHRDEILIQRLATDPHSPPEFRCNQVVRNLDVFYSAFGVSSRDKLWLDPSERVTIW